MRKIPDTTNSDGGDESPAKVGKVPVALPVDGGKPLVFTRQWSMHQASVRAYLASFLGNSVAVDDGIQEVALVVWQKGPWDGDSREFLGYCLACARRVALAARRKQRDTRLELLSPEAAAVLAERVAFQETRDATTSGGRVQALRRCLEGIRPEHRELLESRYSGESGEELRALSKRRGKSMCNLYKTLERLRESLRICVERRQSATE